MKNDHGHDLFRLVYVSRAVLPVLPKFEQTVQDVLVVARANNERMGLTGMLIAHRGWFIQALEGPRRNVSMVFSAIGRDLRHAQLEVLEGGPIAERLFGEWSMYAHSVTPEAAPILAQLDLAPDFDPFQMEGARVLALMKAMADAERLRLPIG